MATRFEPSQVKNKIKREELQHKKRKAKGQEKLRRRLAQAKLEKEDPKAKQRRREENVPRTLDNTREFNPATITADPNAQPDLETSADISTDPFSSYFTSDADPLAPRKILITTSPRSTRVTYDFCEELVSVFPGAELIRRKKGKGFEIGRIAAWAANRGYNNMMVVNEDMKRPNGVTLIHLPEGPSAYFKLTSIVPSSKVSHHARITPHNPELVLNNFVTRLGHTVGRMFQTMFPPLPEFQGRQVVTLHNQRDFLFFRRHRYAFRSPEKVALQEIGPRFTLKLKWLKKSIPAVRNLGEAHPLLEMDEQGDDEQDSVHGGEASENTVEPSFVPGPSGEDAKDDAESHGQESQPKKIIEPPSEDLYEWQWKPELEVTKRTFFL